MNKEQIDEYAADTVFKRVKDFADYMDEYTTAMMVIAISKEHDGSFGCCIRMPKGEDERAMIIETFLMHPDIQPIVNLYLDHLEAERADKKEAERAADNLINEVFKKKNKDDMMNG